MDVPDRKAGLSASIIEGSEELYDFFCQPCNNDGQHLPAEGYCNDCQEYLCGTCFKYHKQPSVTRHHVLLDKKQMPKHKSPTKSSSKDVCTDQCPRHSGKLTEYFCKYHDQLGCSACMTVSHRGCTGVGYIPDIADGIEKTKDFIQLQKTLNDLKQKVEQNENKAKENTKAANLISEGAMAEIRKLRDEINELFDTVENEMSRKVKMIRDEDVASMTSVSADCDSVKADITSITSGLDSKLKAKKNSHVFVEMKKAENKIKSIENKVAKISNDNTIRQYTFEPEKQITDIIANLKTLGNLSMLPEIHGNLSYTELNKSSPIKSSKPIQTQTQAPAQQHGGKHTKQHTASAIPMSSVSKSDAPVKLPTVTSPRTAHHTADVNVRTDSDKIAPYITGIALLSDGRLAFADFSNSSLKIIDAETSQITCHKTSISPWDVTEVTKGQIAFTCGHTITFLTISSTPYQARNIDVGGYSHGIAYHQNRLVVTFQNPPKVEIIDTNGTVLQSFMTDSSEEQLFKCPHYTAVSLDGNTIYISDVMMDRVISLSLDGLVKDTYTLPSPTGLAIDKYGSVYVCQCTDCEVHQLTPDLNRSQELLRTKDGIILPYSLTYCDKEGKLYVGMDGNDYIKVFQLK